jgi:S-adenosylmethionine-diacylglycerol 3-amino-3-carboxypropyl transferase
VDTSREQLFLCKIKYEAASHLEPLRAAQFLGYMEMDGYKREQLYQKEIGPYLETDANKFWTMNCKAIKLGVIHAGRFEKYMQKVSYIARKIIGENNLFRLLECTSLHEQEEIFERYIQGQLLRLIFKTAFHPLIYKNRGVDPVALRYSTTKMSDFFLQRFKGFCCTTLARNNYYFQFVFFGKVLYPDALPEFIRKDTHHTFLKNKDGIAFRLKSIQDTLSETTPGKFNKVQLSNIGDWLSPNDIIVLYKIMQDKTLPGAKMLFRYIYKYHPIPDETKFLKINADLGDEVITRDRYPFYSVMPIDHINHEFIPDKAA